jgi:hypothetical protein
MADKTRIEIEAAGFRVVKTHRLGRWYEVVGPDGEAAAILRQSGTAWHWFARDYQATASGSSVATCDRGGLGDAIGGGAEMAAYRHLLRETNVPHPLRMFEGVHVAMRQMSRT